MHCLLNVPRVDSCVACSWGVLHTIPTGPQQHLGRYQLKHCCKEHWGARIYLLAEVPSDQPAVDVAHGEGAASLSHALNVELTRLILFIHIAVHSQFKKAVCIIVPLALGISYHLLYVLCTVVLASLVYEF